MELVKKYHKDVIGVVLMLCLTTALFGCSMSQEEFVEALDAGVSEVEVEELRPTATVNAVPQEVIESTNEIIVPIFDEQDNVIGTEVLSE